MIRLGPLIWRGYMKEWLLKILVFLWTVFLWGSFVCGFFFPKGKNFYVRDECLCALVPWVVPSCVLEAGVLRIHTSFQKQLRSLFSIPIFVRIASGIHIVVWVSGVPRNVASAAVLGMMLSFWLGVLLLSLSSPCCSSLFSAHAQSTCFMFPLLHSCFLASVLN